MSQKTRVIFLSSCYVTGLLFFT